MTLWEVNHIYLHREFRVNFPSVGKIPLKIRVVIFSLNKFSTKFQDIPTSTSTIFNGDNDF